MKSPSSILIFGAFTVFAMATSGFGQILTQAARQRMDGQPEIVPGAKMQRMTPQALRSNPGFLRDSNPSQKRSIQGNPGGLPGIDSVPNFTRAFSSHGQVWPFTMIGNEPLLGHRTRVPARMIAVSLELQNADLVTTTEVPIAPFEKLALRSPNFEETDYTSGEDIQFADAVQRAEFFHSMKKDWHTELNPARIVDHVTIQVPRFTTVDVNGTPTQVRTYFTGPTGDGGTFVLLLDSFFNDAFFNTVVTQIGANHFTTDAVNIVLLPNTFIFSLEQGPAGALTLGFHTFIFDPTTDPTPVWVTVFASWISPGLFNAGIEDVTALSHEISETFNNPFLINTVPAWQFPGIPGSCQDNLEVGDPIEALGNETVPIRVERGHRSFVYHPQIEALLQWFEEVVPSDAIRGAYSYPDTTALPGPAVFFGQLSCSTGP
ncbi:MAG TPA: hypothetical protein VFF39_12715 [Verrucomicrobiae bacterium]|nr:hypothetical protein [Verrucomicrobiae bacterium]